jgi:hypothetical protein
MSEFEDDFNAQMSASRTIAMVHLEEGIRKKFGLTNTDGILPHFMAVANMAYSQGVVDTLSVLEVKP